MEKLVEARDILKEILGGFKPVIAITLGSGLGYMTKLLRGEEVDHCTYEEIPHCPSSGATGHAGELWWGELNGVPVIMLRGRVHLYEGYDIHEVVFLTRLMIMLGIKKLILTHATGAVTKNLIPGDIVAVWSQISAGCPDPTSGPEIFKANPDDNEPGMEFCPPDIAFDERFLQIARECALRQKVALHRGVSHFKFGRTYESWAEAEAMARAGADVGTMSTVPEVMAAAQMGAKVLDLALVTDMAGNVRDNSTAVSHGEVLDVAKRMQKPFGRLITAIVKEMGAL